MSKLENRVYKAFGSINFNFLMESDINLWSVNIENMFKKYIPCKDYIFIWHTDSKTLHIHFLLFLTKQVRLSTIMNYIADSLDINTLAINIDNCRGVSLCLRYMLHIDESSKLEGKYVYSRDKFISNLDVKNINIFIEQDDDDEITSEMLVQLVMRFPNKSDLLMYLGLKSYHKYRSEIKDLIDDVFHLNAKYYYLLEDKHNG